MNKERNENSAGPMEDAYRVGYLIAGYLQNTLTDEERDELDEWVTASDANMRLFAELTDEKNIEKGLKERGLYDADKAVERLKAGQLARYKKHRSKKVHLLGYGIAACLVLLAGIFFLVPLVEKKNPQPPLTATNDLLPGGDRAVLQLPNGQQIVLDSLQGTILNLGGQRVENDRKALRYMGQTGEVAFHTLTTPKGGQYQVVLPDGTRVWLNAASSIRFPTAFSAGERRVDISGEAYFEVAHDAAKPFRVFAGDAEVTVLGTRFNVSAYPDEEGLTTTLLEGSVKVSSAERNLTLKPGQQALVRPEQVPAVVADADLEEVMGWKEGVFEFKNEPIEPIMREVARWYNAEVKYEGKINYHFNASIGRNVPVSRLLHFLELTNRVHFTIENNTIIVKP